MQEQTRKQIISENGELTISRKKRGPRGRYRPSFRWTPERVATLIEAYMQGSADELTSAAVKRISQAQGWRAKVVADKLYPMHHELAAKRAARAQENQEPSLAERRNRDAAA